MSVAPGTRPGQGGSSGTLDRKVSRLFLKSSSEHLDRFLSSWGKILKSFGPTMLKLSSRLLFLENGTRHIRSLLLVSTRVSIPGYGTNPWRFFQT